MAAVQKLENLAWQYRIQGSNVALGASGPLKRPMKCFWRWVKKTGLSG
ncbi:hypothetical protein ACNKHO_15785 [Shigella flexneri]